MHLAIRGELADHAVAIDLVPLTLDLNFVGKLAGGAAVRVRSAVTLAAAVERLFALALELHVFVPVVGRRRRGPEQRRRKDTTGRPRTGHCAAATGSLTLGGLIALMSFALPLAAAVVLFRAPARGDRNVPCAGRYPAADAGSTQNGGMLDDPFLVPGSSRRRSLVIDFFGGGGGI